MHGAKLTNEWLRSHHWLEWQDFLVGTLIIDMSCFSNFTNWSQTAECTSDLKSVLKVDCDSCAWRSTRQGRSLPIILQDKTKRIPKSVMDCSCVKDAGNHNVRLLQWYIGLLERRRLELYAVLSCTWCDAPRARRLRGCKNWPAPFPGRMSYKATKLGLVLFYILACINCIVAYYGPFYVGLLLIFVGICSVFWLF